MTPKLDRSGALSSILKASKKPGTQNEHHIPLSDIRVNPDQPRKYFSEIALEQLAASIATIGVIEPVLLREKDGGYELVAGERRYRAAQWANLETIPATIRALTDEQALEIALTENLNREDLNPVEETDSTLKLLAVKLGLTDKEVVSAIRGSHYKALGRADNTGVNNKHVVAIETIFKSLGRLTASSFYSHRLPVLRLPRELLDSIRHGEIEYSKAKLIGTIKDQGRRKQLLDQAVRENLSREQLRTLISTRRDNTSVITTSEDGARLTSVRKKLTDQRIGRLPKTKQKAVLKLLAQLEDLLKDT